jgi:chromate transport protein ChrA
MEKQQQQLAWRRWLTGPIVWTGYFMVVYLFVEAACEMVILSETAVLPLTLVLTLLTGGIIAAAGYQAWRSNDESFANASSVFLNALFLLLTLAVGVTVLVLPPC